MSKKILKVLAAVLLLGLSAEASTHSFKFDGPTDPTTDGTLAVFRAGDNIDLSALAGVWIATNGSTLESGVANQSTNGYLAITQTTPLLSAHGMRSGIIFDDFDAGLVVAGFTFTCDVRIGAGSDSPADGFSLNFVRANDPVILNNDGSGFACHAAGCGTEQNLPEEGTTTGLSVCFDAWDSGAPDVIGLTIRVDNIIITNVALPTLNGACADATSLQTGPNGGGLAGLCWQPLYVELTSSGLLNVSYKGNPYLTNFVVNFAPSAGRLVFAGRTGGAWQEQDVDNITIVTVPSATPVVAQPFVANANGFRLTITDSGASSVDTNSLTIQLDGVSVTPSLITKDGTLTTVAYQNTALLLASGSSHTGSVHFTGSGFAGSVDVTNNFVIPAYLVLSSAQKAPGAVNTSLSGFTGRIHQLPVARFPDEGSLISVERQLADGFIDPNTGLPYGSNAGVSNFTDEVINWNQNSPNGADVGFFRANATPPADWPDEPIPGTDSSVSDPDHLAAEFLTILDLPVGSYQLGVNHDDGFKLTAGAEPRDVFNASLLATDRSATDTPGITIVITNAGKYPLRLVYGENTGGAQLEFYLVDFLTGTKVLINNRTNPVQITTYRDTAALTQPFVRWVSPAPGETGVNPDTGIIVKLDNGTAGTITDGSISIQLNGSGTATHTRSGGEVVATLASAGRLSSGSSNSVTLIYSTSLGGPFTNTWQFVVAPYQILPVSLRTPLGSGDASKPGIKYQAQQFSTNYYVVTNGFSLPLATINDLNFSISQAKGLWGPNAANTSAFTDNGFFDETGGINYGGGGGTVQPDTAFPFLPGSDGLNDNVLLEAITYVEFPAAGFYTMGVQSDDGFEVTVGDSHGNPDLLTVSAPLSIARPYGAYPVRGYEDGALFPRRTGRVIKADPIDMGGGDPTLILNSNAFKGNIVIFRRSGPNNTGGGNNTFRFNVLQSLGAIGGIDVVGNNEFPFGLAPGVSFPALQLFPGDGNSIIAQATTDTDRPVLASLGGGDRAQVLGSFNGGRGDGTPTTFGLYAPLAGVYPLRLIWQNGGGGFSVEWWSQDSGGGAHLVGNGIDPSALKAYRARTVTGGAPHLGTIVSVGNSVVVSWTGIGELQRAGDVAGPYYRTPNQDNPQTNSVSNAQVFYRVRQY